MNNILGMACLIDGRIVAGEKTAAHRRVAKVYAGNRISDILRNADNETLLVSGLASRHLLDVAQLLEVPCVCLAGSVSADSKLAQLAESRGIVLIVSALEADEICGRLGKNLSGEAD